MSRSPRILHAPVDVGGQPWGFSQGLQALGFESQVVVFDQAYTAYPADQNLELRRWSTVDQWWRRWQFFLKVIRRYDVCTFYFAQSLLPYGLDLPLVRLLGKRVVVIFQGCDVRLQHMTYRTERGRKTVDHGATCDVCQPIPDLLKRLRTGWYSLWAHRSFVLNPDLLFVVPKAKFLPYGHINPDDLRGLRARRNQSNRQPSRLTILHAPTQRRVKGTEAVLQAIRSLQQRGRPIDLILVEGRPHAKLIELLSKADLVIDQLRIGWYGSLSVEAMAAGLPVICYLDPILLRVSGMEGCPIVSATAETVGATIERLLDDPQERRRLGQAGVRFVERYHHPQRVAERLAAAF